MARIAANDLCQLGDMPRRWAGRAGRGPSAPLSPVGTARSCMRENSRSKAGAERRS
jgi:hypothetical protein